MSPKPLLGLFGGTFDPIHNGHLYIANYCLKHLGFKSIRFIPNRRPPHRLPSQVSTEDRLQMLRLATLNNHELLIDDIEIARPAPSYLYDTLTTYRARMPQQSLSLILGMDAFKSLPSWFRWNDYLSLVHIIIVDRDGITLEKDSPLLPLLKTHYAESLDALSLHTHGKIFHASMPEHTVSATEIRHKLANAESIDNLVPLKVREYIHQHHLY